MKLAKIKEIKPRDVWANEATDFTPWLAEEENLAMLSEAISLDLELYSREEQYQWFKATCETFIKFFQPIVKAL